MRVRCVNKGRSTILEIGKEYEVFEEIGDKYLVSTKLIGAVLYLKEYFEIIKEDKMEDIRVIRKLEDLDGLENGMGLKVFLDKNDYTLSVGIPWHWNIINRVNARENEKVEYFLKSLKSMGFKFEYKPSRSLGEVIDEMRTKAIPFVFNEKNYYINYVKQYNSYYVAYDCFNDIVGALYLDEKTAKEYCDELNGIIKANCNG